MGASSVPSVMNIVCHRRLSAGLGGNESKGRSGTTCPACQNAVSTGSHGVRRCDSTCTGWEFCRMRFPYSFHVVLSTKSLEVEFFGVTILKCFLVASCFGPVPDGWAGPVCPKMGLEDQLFHSTSHASL